MGDEPLWVNPANPGERYRIVNRDPLSGLRMEWPDVSEDGVTWRRATCDDDLNTHPFIRLRDSHGSMPGKA